MGCAFATPCSLRCWIGVEECGHWASPRQLLSHTYVCVCVCDAPAQVWEVQEKLWPVLGDQGFDAAWDKYVLPCQVGAHQCFCSVVYRSIGPRSTA